MGYLYTPDNGAKEVSLSNPLPVRFVGVNSTQLSVVITNGTSLSPAIDLAGNTLVGIHMPSTWTAASITFQASEDGVTFDDFYDANGVEKTITVSNSRYIYLSPADWIGVRSIKIRSGTSASPIVQAADRTIKLATKAV